MKKIIANIEKQFKQLGYFVFAQRWLVILFSLLLFGAMASQLPKIKFDTSNEAFMEPDDPVLVEYDNFRNQYGRDEVIVISLKPKDVFDKNFLEKLKLFHDDLENEVPNLDEVISLVNATSIKGEENELIVEELLENWPESPAEILALKKDVLSNKFYKNLLISEDGTFTTVMVRSNAFSAGEELDENEMFGDDMFAEGTETNAEFEKVTEAERLTDQQNTEFINAVQIVAARHQTADFPMQVAGSPAMTGMLKGEMMKSMPRFTAVAIGLIAILLLLLFRTPLGVFLPLITVIMTLLSTVGLMAGSGTPFTVITQILPSLILAVGVGYSVHMLTIYFHHVYRNGDKREAIAFALGHSGLAILMTSLTTTGGLLSFVSAQLPPISDLGFFGAIGVMLTVFYSLLFVPALIAVLPTTKKRIVEDDQDGIVDKILDGFGTFAVNRPWTVIIFSLFLAVISIVGISQLRFSHNVLAWLPEESPVRIATEVIDKNLKGTSSVEIVIDTGKINGVKSPQIMAKLDQFNQYAEQWSNGELAVGKSTSVADTLKQIHQALNENQESFYQVPEDPELIAQELILFENSGSDDLENVVDTQFAQARITVKTSWADAGTYNAMIKELSAKANEIFTDVKQITVTGLIPLMARTIDLVMVSMTSSYTIAAIVITVMMILLLNSLSLGLWSMIPNFLPIMMGLGLMGALDLPLDMMSMLVGSIALGLAVDDTVHFLHNFRRYYHETGDVSKSVSDTLHTTGRALLFSTIALSIGFFAYTQSSLNNLYSFGLMTGITIIFALLADLLLAPAMMALIYRKKM